MRPTGRDRRGGRAPARVRQWRSLLALLDLAVRAGEHQSLVAVGEPHQIRRPTLLAPDLDDLALSFTCSDSASVHTNPVSYGCSHR